MTEPAPIKVPPLIRRLGHCSLHLIHTGRDSGAVDLWVLDQEGRWIKLARYLLAPDDDGSCVVEFLSELTAELLFQLQEMQLIPEALASRLASLMRKGRLSIPD